MAAPSTGTSIASIVAASSSNMSGILADTSSMSNQKSLEIIEFFDSITACEQTPTEGRGSRRRQPVQPARNRSKKARTSATKRSGDLHRGEVTAAGHARSSA